MPSTRKNLTGEYLNKLWNVGAKHALYREDGKWYHQLSEFPGALFDANGYVVFQTEADYRESPYMQIQQDLHVTNGISAMPNYIRVTENAHLQLFSQQIKKIAETTPVYNAGSAKRNNHKIPKAPRAIDFSEEPNEAKRAFFQSYRIIRDTQIAQWVKYLHEYQCQICGQSIELSNGQFYAEAHHIKPLGQKHNGPDVVENVLCVCPNHHAQLDYGAIRLEKSKLRLVAGHDISDKYILYHNEIVYHHVSH